LGVVRLSTTCPRTFTLTGATITSGSGSIDEYRGGVMGDDEADDGEDERVGESESIENDEGRKGFRAGGGRMMRSPSDEDDSP